MRFMTSGDYRAILARLPIENPTPRDMAELCPHLTEKEAVAAFKSGSGFVACPPLRVRGAFQIITFCTGDGPRLDWSFAGRLSHAASRLYVAEATAFAGENWGKELVEDTWRSFVDFHIADPSDLIREGISEGRPRSRAQLSVCLGRDWNEIGNDRTRPQSVQVDEAILQMTLDRIIGHELKGERGGFETANCAYCGDELGLGICGGCGHCFRDSEGAGGGHMPLSPRMVAFLTKHGHVFRKDPALAQQAEAERFRALLERIAERERIGSLYCS